jgi:hypothetical protein
VPRVVRVGGIGLGRAGEHPEGWATARSTQPTAGSLSPERRPRATSARDVGGDVTPFTRRLPEGNIGTSTGFSCEQYGGSRTGVVGASEPKGESNSALGPTWAGGAIRRGLLAGRRSTNHTLEPAGGQDRRDPGRRPGIRLGVACERASGTVPDTTNTAPPLHAERRGRRAVGWCRQLCCATSALRSDSLNPPQMPWGSRMRSAYPRQGSRTGHVRQMALACSSRLSFSLFRSKCGGGKNTTACGPRHAAFTCHASSTRCALTDYPPSKADHTAAHRAKQGKSSCPHDACRTGLTAGQRHMDRWSLFVRENDAGVL